CDYCLELVALYNVIFDIILFLFFFFFFQAEDGIRDRNVTGVQTCALPISLNLYCNRARLLNKNTKDTRDHSRVFCYFKWFCPLSWKTESRANFDFAEYGFRYEKHNGQNKKDKGLRWRFFSAAF